jgi:hypothetical protein
MVTVVLRLHGIEVESCKTWIPQDQLDGIWCSGDKLPNGKVVQIAGANLRLGEGDDIGSLVVGSMELLRGISNHLQEELRRGARASLDIALYVEDGLC